MTEHERPEHHSIMHVIEEVVQVPKDEPVTDRLWSIESNGITHVTDAERHGKPSEMFWVWFAANMGITALPFGAYLVTFYSCNLWQAILAAILGCVLSYALVGVIGVAGQRTGAPTMVISRASFGVSGNALPTLVSYMTCVGFEIVLMAVATDSLGALLTRLGVGGGKFTLGVSFAIVAAVAIAISLLGHATIVRMATIFTWIYGVLMIPFIMFSWKDVNFHKVSTLPTGHFLGGFIGGITIVAVGLGIGWVNTGADYTRYLPKGTSPKSLIGWTVVGSSIAPIILIVFGAMLAASDGNLAVAANPVAVLAGPLPTWFLVPFLLATAIGLIAATLTEMYSSGLSLITLGLRIPRYRSVLIDGALMIVGVVYIVFFSPSFFGAFAGFVTTFAAILAPWAAIFILDMWLYRKKGYADADLYVVTGRYGAWNWAGITAFVVSSVVALGMVTSAAPAFRWTGFLLGPFGGKSGAVGASNLGAVFGMVIAGVLYVGLVRLVPQYRRWLQDEAGAAGAAVVAGEAS
jgi:NCS1 family nucleobase:cation symporter-1